MIERLIQLIVTATVAWCSLIGATAKAQTGRVLVLDLTATNDPAKESILAHIEALREFREYSDLRLIEAPSAESLKLQLREIGQSEETFDKLVVLGHGTSDSKSLTIFAGADEITAHQSLPINETKNILARDVFSGIRGKLKSGALVYFMNCKLLAGSQVDALEKAKKLQELVGLETGTIIGHADFSAGFLKDARLKVLARNRNFFRAGMAFIFGVSFSAAGIAGAVYGFPEAIMGAAIGSTLANGILWGLANTVDVAISTAARAVKFKDSAAGEVLTISDDGLNKLNPEERDLSVPVQCSSLAARFNLSMRRTVNVMTLGAI